MGGPAQIRSLGTVGNGCGTVWRVWSGGRVWGKTQLPFTEKSCFGPFNKNRIYIQMAPCKDFTHGQDKPGRCYPPSSCHIPATNGVSCSVMQTLAPAVPLKKLR